MSHRHPYRSLLRFWILPLVACGPSPDTRLDTDPPPALAGSESRVITSATTGRDYQITVALPRDYPETQRTYPVLYALDANGEFGTVVEAARLMRYEDLVPELVIVGIGYPVGRMWDATAPRALDLTPTSDPEYLEREKLEYPEFPAAEGSGGGPGFLRFIVEELIPLVESEYRTDHTDRALFGHSYGGLFAAYALLNGQGAFRKFIVGSPSLWWDNRVLFDMEAAHSDDHRSLPARVFFSVGLLEDVDEPEYAMVSNLREFLAILESRTYDGLELETMYFEDETHTSVIPATISRGLRAIYRGWAKPGA